LPLSRQRRFLHGRINIRHPRDDRLQFAAQRSVKRARDEVSAWIDADLAFQLVVIRIEIIGHPHRPEREIRGGEPRPPSRPNTAAVPLRNKLTPAWLHCCAMAGPNPLARCAWIAADLVRNIQPDPSQFFTCSLTRNAPASRSSTRLFRAPRW
jgi:hypothetical protein